MNQLDIDRLAAAKLRRQKRQDRLRLLNTPMVEPEEVDSADFWVPDEETKKMWRAERDNELKVMREVKRLVRRRVYRDILSYMEECDTSDYSIVKEPMGDNQEQDGYAFKHAYIYQYSNGGYSGDDFAGWICIPLNAGKYLKFHYSC